MICFLQPAHGSVLFRQSLILNRNQPTKKIFARTNRPLVLLLFPILLVIKQLNVTHNGGEAVAGDGLRCRRQDIKRYISPT